MDDGILLIAFYLITNEVLTISIATVCKIYNIAELTQKALRKKIRRWPKLTSLKYQRLEDLVNAIGLPKEKVCTHYWDGSSYF